MFTSALDKRGMLRISHIHASTYTTRKGTHKLPRDWPLTMRHKGAHKSIVLHGCCVFFFWQLNQRKKHTSKQTHIELTNRRNWYRKSENNYAHSIEHQHIWNTKKQERILCFTCPSPTKNACPTICLRSLAQIIASTRLSTCTQSLRSSGWPICINKPQENKSIIRGKCLFLLVNVCSKKIKKTKYLSSPSP